MSGHRSIWGTCNDHQICVEVSVHPDAGPNATLDVDSWDHWNGLECPACGRDVEEGRDPDTEHDRLRVLHAEMGQLRRERDAVQEIMEAHRCGAQAEAAYARAVVAEKERDQVRARVEALHRPELVQEIDPATGARMVDERGNPVVMARLCVECTPDATLDLDVIEGEPFVAWPCPTLVAVAGERVDQ